MTINISCLKVIVNGCLKVLKMENNIINLIKLKKFKQVMVRENYNLSSSRKVLRLIRLKNFDNEYFKKAIVKPEMPIMIGDAGMSDTDQTFNMSYDLYKNTKNRDKFNNISEFEYVETIKKDTDLKLCD